jgi:NO-binding membrane sensor protein with MHYT domain
MMTGSYNLSLVALSFAIAVIASYTALDLAKRVSESASSRGRIVKTPSPEQELFDGRQVGMKS